MSVWGRTRYDKLAANYLAFIHLASIRLWLRVNESTRKFLGLSTPISEQLRNWIQRGRIRSSRRIDPTFSA